MSKFVGRKGSLGIARETTRGTAVNPTLWSPYMTINFDDKVVEVREEQSLGNLADSDSKYITAKHGEGSISAEIYDKALGFFLYSLFGAPSSVGSNPTTHTYTMSQSNQRTSLSLLYQDPDRNKMFTLAVIDSLKITVDLNGIVQYELGVKSKVGKNWTTQTTSFTSLGNKYLHQHLQFRLAANVGALAAATPISLKKLEITIASNAFHDDVLGTVEPEDVLGQHFSVEGQATLNYEDDTYRNYMLDGTYKAMEIKLYKDSNSSLQIQCPRVDFSSWEQDRTLNEIVKQTINFKANYDAANALDIISTLVLINGQSSY